MMSGNGKRHGGVGSRADGSLSHDAVKLVAS